jgi:succinate dehydrogenase / fumarate reductase cytochrome b subunit
MNMVAFFSGNGYNEVCAFLGSNWYAILGTIILAALACFHIVYAFILTIQNRRARGSERYSVTARRPEVSWASQNMLVLGLIILCGLILHLFNFWSHMMLADIAGIPSSIAGSTDGFGWIKHTFANPLLVVLYLVWFCAIWFHLSHGFWSSMQTFGWSGKIWLKRWQTIGIIYVTILMAVFAIIVLSFAFGFAPSLR